MSTVITVVGLVISAKSPGVVASVYQVIVLREANLWQEDTNSEVMSSNYDAHEGSLPHKISLEVYLDDHLAGELVHQ